jgi:glycogen debranching enzyme
MISTTAKILSDLVDLKDNTGAEPTVTLSKYEPMEYRKGETPFPKASLSEVISFVLPCMLKAIKYLQNRDKDNDGLLEQKHNEDWMDTLLRTGKVVYSQACWILALKNLINLLRKLENTKEAKLIEDMRDRAIGAVENKMWSTEEGCYIDLLEADLHLDERMHNRLITQDITLYLVALTEEDYDLNHCQREVMMRRDDSMYKNDTKHKNLEPYRRALSTLNVLKKRTWKNSLPLVTETHVTKTGPWLLEPHEYHNHTFWAWITGIEMLARSRFDRINDCINILSKFISGNTIHSDMLHEWVNPITLQGSGASPFRTGISSVRIAAIELVKRNADDNILSKHK